jgi:magnesium transporter
MQALPFVRAPVPSPAVLKFLRIQAECLPFLASYSQVRRNHHHAPTDTARTHILTSAQCRGSLRVVGRETLASPCRGFWNSATKLRWQKPWQQVRPKKTAPLQPNDLPPLPRLLDDAGAASLGRIVKPTNELGMRCTEFDGDGKVTLVNGAFKKSELIAKVSLYNHHSSKLHLTVERNSVVFFLAISERSTPLHCRIFSYALRPS